MVLIAARLFTLAHGRAPTDPAQLVPEWLDAVPDDPYATGTIAIADGEVRSAGARYKLDDGFQLAWPLVPP